MKRHGVQGAGMGAGMTLVELLVSLGVLTLIGLAFGTILSQTQKVVDTSNALMRANAAASAIAQVIRQDISSMSMPTEGFFEIGMGPTDPNMMWMDFTSVGTYQSQVSPTVVSNSARVFIGTGNSVLFRGAFLLVPDPAPVGYSGGDILYARWLTCYHTGSGGGLILHLPDLMTMWFGPPAGTPAVTLPVTRPDQVDATWPVLATGCLRFKVSCFNPLTNSWEAGTFAWHTEIAPPPWWPKAIKVEFRLKTGDGPNDYLDYEVICPVRQ